MTNTSIDRKACPNAAEAKEAARQAKTVVAEAEDANKTSRATGYSAVTNTSIDRESATLAELTGGEK